MKSDAQLKMEVTAELQREPALHANDIIVDAKNGIVTLSGSVPLYAEKQSAERATQRVEGVHAIAEELLVKAKGGHSRKDAEIAQSVADSLRWHVWIPSQVHAVIENGWVTLSGEVSWVFQRDSAEDAVRFQTGVQGVSNRITLKPTVQATAVQSAIDTALKRHAELDAEHIQVTADGGKITLDGSVHSWNERQQAYSAACSAPGVTSVENNLVVAS